MSRNDSFDDHSDASEDSNDDLENQLDDDLEGEDDLLDDGPHDHISGDHEDDSPGDASSHDSQDDTNDLSNDVSTTSSGRERQRGRGLGRGRGRGREDAAADDNGVDAITGNGGSGNSRKGYRFELDGDTVTNLRQVKRGREKVERIEDGESWAFDGSKQQLVRTELGATGTEVSFFADPDGDQVFTRTSETFTPFAGNSSPIA